MKKGELLIGSITGGATHFLLSWQAHIIDLVWSLVAAVASFFLVALLRKLFPKL